MTATAPVAAFPAAGQEFLRAFYRARKIADHNTEAKVSALRVAYDLENVIITADEGVPDRAMELRILEFYVLERHGII